MPDWSYQPLLRPLLFRLPPEKARTVTLDAIAALAALPGGRAAIDILGHLRAPEGIGRIAFGGAVASPVGVSAGLDLNAVAPAALGRFGIGWIEVGPVALIAQTRSEPLRDPRRGVLCFPDGLPAAGADIVAWHLGQAHRRPPPGVRLAVRLRAARGLEARAGCDELLALAARFAPLADALVLEPPEAFFRLGTIHAWADAVARCVAEAGRDAVVLIAIPPDLSPDVAERLVGLGLDAGAVGVVVAGGVTAGDDGAVDVDIEVEAQRGRRAADVDGPFSPERTIGAPALAATLRTVRQLRARFGTRPTIVAGDGAIEPADARALLAAGADLVGLHAGLVFTGPGLPKRINESLLVGSDAAIVSAANDVANHVAKGRSNGPPWWIAHVLIGLVMTVAGITVGGVAVTAVVLPYDLRWVGLDRTALAGVNPRLLAFMTHDRVSLPGTMVSLGQLYTSLAWFGIRRGVHWAERALGASTVAGLASFFLFLSHGYLDPLHAVLSGVIAVLYVLGRRWPARSPADVPLPDLHNDRAWRRAVTGQLSLVMLALGLVGAGLTIAFLGGSRVFVATDLVFMDTTAAHLATTPRLLPLIAHDRAGLGGALVADGLALAGLVLWGFRRGARWVWWTILIGGLPGFAAALGIHVSIGYLDLGHLAPVGVAVGLYTVGLVACRSYLCDPRGC
ncbi:MAG: hypothetical protein IPG72_14560 [Ardenticatenales bacterium]|nr:hypothetical protein [Ardenticatenales bacterium]